MIVTATHSNSDSWLLHAILNASKQGPVERNTIVAVADHFNHAVITNDELEGGLERLIASEWVQRDGFSFSGTEKALRIYGSIQSQGLSCYEEMGQLDNLLKESTK